MPRHMAETKATENALSERIIRNGLSLAAGSADAQRSSAQESLKMPEGCHWFEYQSRNA